jgi:hypothetical protein
LRQSTCDRRLLAGVTQRLLEELVVVRRDHDRKVQLGERSQHRRRLLADVHCVVDGVDEPSPRERELVRQRDALKIARILPTNS